MDRREFLKSLFAAGAVAAAPKFIFDVGKNLWRQEVVKMTPIIMVGDESLRALLTWADAMVDDLMRVQLITGGPIEVFQQIKEESSCP